MNAVFLRDIRNTSPSNVPLQLFTSLREVLRVGSLLITDSMVLLGAVACSHYVRSALLVHWFGSPTLSLIRRFELFPIYLLIQLLLFGQFQLYRQGDRRRDLWAIARSLTLGIFILFIGSRLYLPESTPSFTTLPIYLIVLWLTGLVAVSGGRLFIDQIVNHFHLSGFVTSNTLLVGSIASAESAFNDLKRPYFKFVGVVSTQQTGKSRGYLGTLTHLEEIIAAYRIQEVLLTEAVSSKEMVRVLNACINQGANLRIALPSLNGINNPISLQTYNGKPMLEIEQPRLEISQFALKRLFDVTSAAMGLLLVSPLLLLIALAIKLDSRGPVFFKQQRVTVHGRTFWMYKFRSMRVDAEEQLAKIIHLNERKDNLMFKMENDPRITRVGRFLRRTSLDELPQIFNVLKGEMSLVGPRPPLPREVDHYAPHHRQRLEVLPGITGLWQVSGRSEIKDFEEVVRLDLSYIRNWSLWLDFKILAKTIPAVINSKGAC